MSEPISRCRDCGAPIIWRRTPNGKLQPINVDGGEVHFATCTKRPRQTYPSNVCLKCGSMDVTVLPGTGPHHGAIRCNDCGQHRWLPKPREA